ncbi:MAG: guanylate kinase [Desulfobacteraceae bacterium]|nr:guanylate kinase [Desulfobacteraceae bacterium]
MSGGQLFVVSAPSGAGKTTVLKAVLSTLPAVGFSVSHTTRPPRPGEVEGRDYFFVSSDEFSRRRQRGDFLEWAEVHGNLYGTSRQAVTDRLAQGQDCVLDIDVQGARQLREHRDLNPVFVFIAPPSLTELERRLTGRQTESAATLALRLANARTELAALDLYDYVIVNDDLSQAQTLLAALILERRARGRRGYDGRPLVLEALDR